MSAIASLSPDWHPGQDCAAQRRSHSDCARIPGRWHLASQILAGAQKQIEKLQLPAGYRIEYGGEDENQNETFAEMRIALGISLMRSFSSSCSSSARCRMLSIVMAAIPLALPGRRWDCSSRGNPFGFTAFIGVISLGGLVVRNSIILVDYIHERMKSGVPLEQATLEAGERRLRPIFLTTMAAAVGVTPMIIPARACGLPWPA